MDPFPETALSLSAGRLVSIASWAQERATPAALESGFHGPRHWRDVARCVLQIAAYSPGCSAQMGFIFAALHDTQRLNEHRDPEHGARAATLACDLATSGLASAAELDLERLVLALERHDRGETTTDPVIGACWDADRLTLGRVWQHPQERFFSCLAGEDFKRLLTRAETIRREADASWEKIATWTVLGAARSRVRQSGS